MARAPRVHLRRATAADAPAAATIIAGALAEYGLPFEPTGRDADVATFGAKEDHDDLVAEDVDNRRVIGVASVGPQGTDGLAWISKVFVAADARRHGAGRALLEAAHESARARGFREVGLRTRVIFHEAIALYQSAGYTRREDPAGLEAGDVVYHRAL